MMSEGGILSEWVEFFDFTRRVALEGVGDATWTRWH